MEMVLAPVKFLTYNLYVVYFCLIFFSLLYYIFVTPIPIFGTTPCHLGGE